MRDAGELRFATEVDVQGAQAAEKALRQCLEEMTKELGTLKPAAKAAGQAVEKGLRISMAAVEGLRLGVAGLTSTLERAAVSGGRLQNTGVSLKAAFAQAAAPLVNYFTPAVNAAVDGMKTALYYAGELFAFLTGSEKSAAKTSEKAAAALRGVGSAAKATAASTGKAARSLADFDEIKRLAAAEGGGAAGSGGSGSASGAVPESKPFEPPRGGFLEALLADIKAGDWGGLGGLIADKLNDAMAAIPWDKLQGAARRWALNLTTALNAAVEALNWALVGGTLAGGVNTALAFLDTAVQTFGWAALGAGIGTALGAAVASIDWPAVGRMLFAGLKIAFEMLYGFASTFPFGELGAALAAALNAGFASIDWAQAGQGVSNFVLGLIAALRSFLQTADWAAIGQDIAAFLGGIDWLGILAGVAGAIGDGLAAAFQLNPLAGLVAVAMLVTAAFGPLLPLFTGLATVLGGLTMGASIFSGVALLLPVLLNPVALAVTAVVAAGVLLIENWAAVCGWANQLWLTVTTAWNNLTLTVTLLVTNFTAMIGALWQALYLGLGAALNGFVQTAVGLWAALAGNVNAAVGALCAAVGGVWAALCSGLTGGMAAVQGGVTAIWGGIVSTVQSAVTTVRGVVQGMLDGIAAAIQRVLNLLNGLGARVANALNAARSAAETAPAPAMYALPMGMATPDIPALANGAVIPANRQFLAMLGDQTSGTNIEAPLETIKQAVAEVLGEFEGGDGQPINIYLGNELLDTVIAGSQRRRALRTGGR